MSAGETCMWCGKTEEEHEPPRYYQTSPSTPQRLCPTAGVSSQFWTPRGEFYASLGRKRRLSLSVEGDPVRELSRYAIRWVAEDCEYVPVLYHDGKRVTKRWSLEMNFESPPDEQGASANTA